MRSLLLTSVAALALSLGVAAASAQSGDRMAPAGSATPAAKASGMPHDSDMKAGMAKDRPASSEGRSAAENPPKAKASDATADAKDAPKAQTPASAQSSEPKAAGDAPSVSKTKTSAAPEKADKAATKADATKTKAAKTDAAKTDAAKTDAAKTDAAKTEAAKTNANADKKTGANARADATAPADLDPQKQERVRNVLANTKVENITNVTFNVSVGAAIPSSVRFHPLPVEIVDIVPQYRGYDYVMIRDEIVIVEPRSRKIVYTFSEGRSVGMNRPSVDCK